MLYDDDYPYTGKVEIALCWAMKMDTGYTVKRLLYPVAEVGEYFVARGVRVARVVLGSREHVVSLRDLVVAELPA